MNPSQLSLRPSRHPDSQNWRCCSVLCGQESTERPVTFQEVFATLYQNLGLNLRAVREFDLRGRPQYLVDQGVEPLRELV